MADIIWLMIVAMATRITDAQNELYSQNQLPVSAAVSSRFIQPFYNDNFYNGFGGSGGRVQGQTNYGNNYGYNQNPSVNGLGINPAFGFNNNNNGFYQAPYSTNRPTFEPQGPQQTYAPFYQRPDYYRPSGFQGYNNIAPVSSNNFYNGPQSTQLPNNPFKQASFDQNQNVQQFPRPFPVTNTVPSIPTPTQTRPVFGQTGNIPPSGQGNPQLRPIQGVFGPRQPGQFVAPSNTVGQTARPSATTGTGGQFRPIQGIFGPGQPGQFESQTNNKRPGPQLRPIQGIFGPGQPGQFESQTNNERPGPQLRPIQGIFGPGLPGQFDQQ